MQQMQVATLTASHEAVGATRREQDAAPGDEATLTLAREEQAGMISDTMLEPTSANMIGSAVLEPTAAEEKTQQEAATTAATAQQEAAAAAAQQEAEA